MSIAIRLPAAAGDQPFQESMQRRATNLSLISKNHRPASARAVQAHPVGMPAQFGSAAPTAATTAEEAKSGNAKPSELFSEKDMKWSAWMCAAQAGDHKAYDKLLRASIPFISMVARRQGVPADVVDDVVQDTLLTLHRIRKTYDSSRSFTAWLRTIARRRAIDILRSQGRKSVREVYEPLAFENYSDPENNPEDEANKVDRRGHLEVAVAALPPKQREAVEQLALGERSLADAAVATGSTPGALKVNLHRALNTLRARIGMENKFDERASIKLASAMHGVVVTHGRALANPEHIFVKPAA